MFGRLLAPSNSRPTLQLSEKYFHSGVISWRLFRAVSSSPLIQIPHAKLIDGRRGKESGSRNMFGSPEPSSKPKFFAAKDDLKDMLKGYTPMVQLQLVEAYRRGVQSNISSQKKTSSLQSATMIILRIISIGLGVTLIIYLFRSPERGIGGSFSKIFDASVASLAENVDVRFSDVQGVSFRSSSVISEFFFRLFSIYSHFLF